MSIVAPNYELKVGEFPQPVLWLQNSPIVESGHDIVVTDEMLDLFLGAGSKQAIKSFGHDEQTGVHFLLTRRGTAVHTDKAYLRYTHQLILRNDGNRVRGLPRYDKEERWHAPMVVGTVYCLDTHSPHQGIADKRFPGRAETRGMKAVLAVDRDYPMDYAECWPLLQTYLGKQMTDFPFDPKAKFLKWKPPAR